MTTKKGKEGKDYVEEVVFYWQGFVFRRRPKKSQRKKPSRKTIFEIYEPSELKRCYFTDFDNEVRNTDIPERMQLREVPITPVPEDSNELAEEAEWIYKQVGFFFLLISILRTNRWLYEDLNLSFMLTK